MLSNLGLTYAIETYGCAMNESDSEIIASILQAAGLQQHQSKTALSGSAESAADAADVILLNTCAIREGAEAKIWGRLDELKSLKRHRERSRQRSPLVGVLGCMAERLKEKLLEAEKKVDLVVGPDAYRDIPRILEVCVSAMESGKGTGDRKSVINTQLSIDETYSDVTPVRRNPESKQSFVSIMRGCNAYCSYWYIYTTQHNILYSCDPAAIGMNEPDSLSLSLSLSLFVSLSFCFHLCIAILTPFHLVFSCISLFLVQCCAV